MREQMYNAMHITSALDLIDMSKAREKCSSTLKLEECS
jgi:hypothetical protein